MFLYEWNSSVLFARTETAQFKKLLVKVPSVYYIIWLRYFLALFVKNVITRDYKEILWSVKKRIYEGLNKWITKNKQSLLWPVWKSICQVLHNHMPLKKKQLRFNLSPSWRNFYEKAIMTCSRLKNICSKKQSYENWDKYKKQWNFCVKLLRKTKQDYFNNIDVKIVSDTKKYEKRVNLISVWTDKIAIKYSYLKREDVEKILLR